MIVLAALDVFEEELPMIAAGMLQGKDGARGVQELKA